MSCSLLLLASVGITSILTLSSLFERPRTFVESKSDFFGELINCPMCTGFWVGLFVFLLSGTINPFYGGAISSLFSWSIISIVELIQLKAQLIGIKIDNLTDTELED